MYYSIFLEMKNDPEIKKWLNMNTKDKVTEILKGYFSLKNFSPKI